MNDVSSGAMTSWFVAGRREFAEAGAANKSIASARAIRRTISERYVTFIIVRSIVVMLGVVLAACSSPAPAPAACATDPRVEVFSPGLTSHGPAGGAFSITSATPSVVQQGINDWTVRVGDAGGNAIAGTLTIKSIMPDHGHGSPTLATVTSNGDGTYGISGINLSMRGVWTITLTIASPALNDAATFTFCVDGSS
jgi:hypothetical protein